MTSVVTLKREVEKIREKTRFKPRNIIVVRMWTPDGKDVPYDGGPIEIKALKDTAKRSK